MTNRLQRVADAVRPEMKARLLLAGPAGSGKTWTALTIAAELAEGELPLVVDTEEESALTYADDFKFKHLPWDPPYHPQELSEAIEEAAKLYPVVVIDSASHFWMEEGGTLDIAGGKFTGWKAARPAQRDLIHSILRARAHMIVCVRSKMDYAQQEGKNGKQEVVKLGMAPIQDATVEYEVNVAAELDIAHTLHISKTRCAVLADRTFPAQHAIDMARIYRDWLRGGDPLAPVQDVEALKRRLNGMSGEDRRRFKENFGHPDHLVDRLLSAAVEFVDGLEKGGTASSIHSHEGHDKLAGESDQLPGTTTPKDAA